LRDETEGTWAATLYFDHLPHEAPERAFELVRTVLASETDRSVLTQLNDKLMIALINAHGLHFAGRIEAEAKADARFSWLLGGAYAWTSDEALKARLAAVADAAGWDEYDKFRSAPAQEINYAALTTQELARAWVEQRIKPEKDYDDNWYALGDYQRELLDNDPDRVIDLILEILNIESNPNVLSLLATGLLEDVVGADAIERIECEAAANARFRDLLGGVWYAKRDEIKTRLDAIVQGNYW
jgi:hypothetical protein